MYIVSWHVVENEYYEGWIHHSDWESFDTLEEAQEYYDDFFSRNKDGDVEVYISKLIKFDQR